MKNKFYIVAAIMCSQLAQAQIVKDGVPAPTSKKEYCAKMKNPDYAKSLLYNRYNQISFSNRGGLVNGGVCWWHSMLTRAATYLTVYRPELPKPTHEQAAKIVQYLTQNKGVVEIPGFKNFYEFTSAHSDIVQGALEGWQIADGGFGFGWVRGLSGNHTVEPAALSKAMDETYKLVKQNKTIAYQKLQMQGIEAHAWLVVDMTKTETGYTLEVVDSNYPGISKIDYRTGSTNLSDYSSVPYTSRNSMDYSAFKYGYDQYCKRNKSAADLDFASTNYGQ